MQFPEEKIGSYGFQAHHFQYDGRECIVVEPAIPLPEKRWVWKAEFFYAFPKFELEMLHRGYYVCFMNVENTFGCPDSMKNFDHFYELLTGEYGFDKYPILLGLSRGGLYIYNWACANPDKVGCVYGDNAVCAIRNWPAGKGKGPRNQENMEKLLKDYHFSTEEEALAYPTPFDNVVSLVNAGVPIVHAAATEDLNVSIEDNTDAMEARVKELGGTIKVFRHPGAHHPHGLDDPKPLADWIEAHLIRE